MLGKTWWDTRKQKREREKKRESKMGEKSRGTWSERGRKLK